MSFVFRDLFPEERTYRLNEVASKLGVHISTIRRWSNEGKLDCMRLGTQRRITYAALMSFTRSHLS